MSVPLTPLQTGPHNLMDPMFLAAVLLELASIVVGLGIAYTAIQGYRRNESRPMLFIAVGFVLVLVVPPLIWTVWLASRELFAVDSNGIVAWGLWFLASSLELVGLGSILYALRMRTE